MSPWSTTLMRAAATALLCALPYACGNDEHAAPGPTGGSAAGGGQAGQGGEPLGGAGAAGGDECLTNVVGLELTISADGVADAQVVPVRYQGVDAYLAVDTGAWLTFIFGAPGDPEYVPHVGDVELGCEIYPVASMTLEAFGPEPFNGKKIVGLLGMDFFSEVPTELDYPGRRVVRHLDHELDATGLTEIAVAWNGDRVVVDAALDQEPVRLIYDAGSPHTMWVGQQGQPGDDEILIGTANGDTIVGYEGTALLDFAGEDDLLVPIFRVPSFPYLQDELDELGAQGLLGATGLGFRRVVFDLPAFRMLLGPRVEP